MARRKSSLRIKSNLGVMVLAVWLILSGLATFVPTLKGLGEIYPLMALAAGFLLLIER